MAWEACGAQVQRVMVSLACVHVTARTKLDPGQKSNIIGDELHWNIAGWQTISRDLGFYSDWPQHSISCISARQHSRAGYWFVEHSLIGEGQNATAIFTSSHAVADDCKSHELRQKAHVLKSRGYDSSVYAWLHVWCRWRWLTNVLS